MVPLLICLVFLSQLEAKAEGDRDPVVAKGRVVVDPITVYLIWLGTWEEHHKQAVRTAIVSLSDRSVQVPSLANWWNITSQYLDEETGRPVTSVVSLSAEECFSPLNGSLTEQDMFAVISQALNWAPIWNMTVPLRCSSASGLPEHDPAFYQVLVSSDVRFPEDISFNKFCRQRISYSQYYLAWVRVPVFRELCNLWGKYGTYLAPPNGDTTGGLDTLISNILVNIADIAVSPDDLVSRVVQTCPSPTGWPTSRMPVIEDFVARTSFNLFGINGSRFMVQQLWDQKTSNCALQPIEYCRGVEEITEPSGIIKHGLIVEHAVGLQPYSSNINCSWKVSVSGARYIRFTLNYLSITPKADYLRLYSCFASHCASEPSLLVRSFSGQALGLRIDLPSSNFLLNFTSGEASPNSMGWEVEYKAAFCHGTQMISSPSGIITDGTPEGQHYLENHKCAWYLDAEVNSPVYLNFTRFQTVESQDMLFVYSGNEPNFQNVVNVYTGNYSALPHHVFTGPILLVFMTTTNQERGWAVTFSMRPAQKNMSKEEVMAIVSGALCGMVMIGLAILGHSLRGSSRSTVQATPKYKRINISREDLEQATDMFSPANLISEGSTNSVFKGALPQEEGKVAVKRWTCTDGSAAREVQLLLRIDHLNIVRLLGWTGELLVFEYMPNGALAKHLFDTEYDPISWQNRLKIAVQVAKALEYLHTFCEPSIVHGRLCAEAVLLDACWNAKLAKFGGALSSHTATLECFLDSSDLKAQDVHSFGQLLLELLTGNRETQRALEMIEAGAVFSIVDKRLTLPLGSTVGMRTLTKMAEIGTWCMAENSAKRPSIMEVCSGLAQLYKIFLRSKRSN